MEVKMLGVSGSMGENAVSMRALRHVLSLAETHGAQTRLFDLREADLPMYRPGPAPALPMLETANAAVNWADVIVLATPDYHGSMSGAMKNFLDYHWREFAGKLFGYICASREKGLTAMEQMRTAVRQCYGWSLPYGVAVHAREDFDDNMEFSNAVVEQRLGMMARDLVVYGTILSAQFQRDLAEDEPFTFAARYRPQPSTLA
jgi:FMN reductase